MTWYNSAPLALTLFGLAALSSSSFTQPVAAQPPGDLSPELASVWSFFRREADDRRAGRNGSPRPIDFAHCDITPGHNQRVWNRTPLFTWQGTSSQIGVRQPYQATLWRESAPTLGTTDDGELYRAYRPTEPLSPGPYEWLFYLGTAQEPVGWTDFKVMDDDAYEEIAAELDTLEASLAAKEAEAETVTLARVAFFVERDLGADALQELFSVADPSPEIQQRQAEVVEMFCAPELSPELSPEMPEHPE